MNNPVDKISDHLKNIVKNTIELTRSRVLDSSSMTDYFDPDTVKLALDNLKQKWEEDLTKLLGIPIGQSTKSLLSLKAIGANNSGYLKQPRKFMGKGYPMSSYNSVQMMKKQQSIKSEIPGPTINSKPMRYSDQNKAAQMKGRDIASGSNNSYSVGRNTAQMNQSHNVNDVKNTNKIGTETAEKAQNAGDRGTGGNSNNNQETKEVKVNKKFRRFDNPQQDDSSSYDEESNSYENSVEDSQSSSEESSDMGLNSRKEERKNSNTTNDERGNKKVENVEGQENDGSKGSLNSEHSKKSKDTNKYKKNMGSKKEAKLSLAKKRKLKREHDFQSEESSYSLSSDEHESGENSNSSSSDSTSQDEESYDASDSSETGSYSRKRKRTVVAKNKKDKASGTLKPRKEKIRSISGGNRLNSRALNNKSFVNIKNSEMNRVVTEGARPVATKREPEKSFNANQLEMEGELRKNHVGDLSSNEDRAIVKQLGQYDGNQSSSYSSSEGGDEEEEEDQSYSNLSSYDSFLEEEEEDEEEATNQGSQVWTGKIYGHYSTFTIHKDITNMTNCFIIGTSEVDGHVKTRLAMVPSLAIVIRKRGSKEGKKLKE